MTQIPSFGEKLESVDYQPRYGVYAIVSREIDGKICLVQTPNGAFYLPGGEIEAGEDQESALKRELLEELGAEMEIGNFLGQADEYFYSSHRDQHYYNPAYIYSLKTVNFDHAPLEDFNKLVWFDYEDALLKLKRGSHKWGLEAWKAQQN
ncbi:NUDIX hydrolase [Lactococcus termiticola]|uniref:NUDIX family hydrolase n=1 Tax=Lactococcus termiticola TaxID=2169526 RepID=A0A2R5HFT1_9LACT|nr:NUDIX hydrolase [Lactococcus termiticola]GBG96852.1 NUDIX family hydrolase [Lactococcus termiticola]